MLLFFSSVISCCLMCGVAGYSIHTIRNAKKKLEEASQMKQHLSNADGVQKEEQPEEEKPDLAVDNRRKALYIRRMRQRLLRVNIVIVGAMLLLSCAILVWYIVDVVLMATTLNAQSGCIPS
jgi:hypothetical protein